MRFSFKLTIALLAIVVFCGGCGRTAHIRSTDLLFTQARQLEDSGKKEEALNEYREIAKSNATTKPEAAAKALFEGGLFASERFGSSEEAQHKGLQEAVGFWEQLVRDYPKTEAAEFLLKPYSSNHEKLMVDLYTKLSHA